MSWPARLFLALCTIVPAALLGSMLWRSSANQAAMAEWREWCAAVGGIPTEPRGMPPTCFAKEAIMERNRK